MSRASTAPQGASDDRLTVLIGEVAEQAGYDLEALTVLNVGRRRIVRVVIDSDRGVSLDDVADVSRLISQRVEQESTALADPTGDAPYTLEVTSPGVGRPLTAPRHFRRARGRLLAVTRTDGSQILGWLAGADPNVIRLLTVPTKPAAPKDIEELALSYDQISRAAVEVEFGPPPPEVVKRLAEMRPSNPDEGDGRVQ